MKEKTTNNAKDKIKLLDLKNDYVFKRVFGYIGSENITKNFINSIIETKLESINLDCKTITEKDFRDDKFGILDIRAKANDGTQFNIEMQMIDNKNTIERMLFYWSKLYSLTIGKGNDYKKLKPTIIIFIMNYKLEKLREIEEYCTKWRIYEEKHKNISLTNHLQFYILELTKFDETKVAKTDKDFWIKFIKTLEVDSNMNDGENKKALTEAEKLLEKISEDENEKYLAIQREIHQLDINSMYSQGREEGEKNKSKEIAKNMIKNNEPLEKIVNYTGLSKEEIEKLYNEK